MSNQQADGLMPEWVPSAARVYLAHTEQGTSIRSLARAEGCHASTVLRRVRRLEQRRDDPLVDRALRRLGAATVRRTSELPPTRDDVHMHHVSIPPAVTDPATLDKDIRRALRRLGEPGACLAIATGMENAVVVRQTPAGDTVRTAVLPCAVAEVMALRGWITATVSGKITRYAITASGRAALKQQLDQAAALRPATNRGPEVGSLRMRYGAAESPLLALARRRERDGTPFLTDDLVAAAERMREDYELALAGLKTPPALEALLAAAAGDLPEGDALMAPGPEMARLRLGRALADLGPGLSDVALRCCCCLEGMESIERRMGWAARSGKIVLRIALQRLRRYYDTVEGRWAAMVG
ncbi:DUF6456 domain-containing protein [Oceaniglobus roseus]|uniref:DUF6456 domain-containing protein n=1 Tax=Oceaniglobus roseus TaxID=1737570 RepID=UPI000C7F3357|nr:DUF6456 domain-containing protein [Kandeliimicrobium roseum]